jgi:hypothetical protein
MKKTALFLFFLSPLFSFAQGSDTSGTKSHKNEFGLDMIYFLNIFRNQWEPVNENTMVFAFDHHLKKDRFVRMYLSTGLVKFTTRPDTGALTHNVQTDLIALPGFGWEGHVNKRWSYFYGLQARVENASGKDIRGDARYGGVQTTYFSNWYLGPSAFTGVSLHVNERISFQVEMDINFIYYHTREGFANEKFPEQDYENNEIGFSTQYFVPRTILLNYAF